MHEMSLADSVLQIIEDTARTQDFTRVRRMTLEIGRLAAVEPEAMRFAFDAVMRGTLADGASLEIIEIPGQGQCAGCGATMEMEEAYGLCPQCDGAQLRVVSGDRMRVKYLEVE